MTSRHFRRRTRQGLQPTRRQAWPPCKLLGPYAIDFKIYVESHPDEFCKLRVVLNGIEAGLGRLWLEYKPKRIWHIPGITAKAMD
jgi:hypothetical protein